MHVLAQHRRIAMKPVLDRPWSGPAEIPNRYRDILKYVRYRIPNRLEKIPTKIPNTDTDVKYRHRTMTRTMLCLLYCSLHPWLSSILSAWKNNGSPGPDGIPAEFYKVTDNLIFFPLSVIYHLSLQFGNLEMYLYYSGFQERLLEWPCKLSPKLVDMHCM